MWRKQARDQAEKSLELEPNLGEGHHALGLCYYWFDRDYESALRQFAIAQSLLPNDSGDCLAYRRDQAPAGQVAGSGPRLSADSATRSPECQYPAGSPLCLLRHARLAEHGSDRTTSSCANAKFIECKTQIGYVEFWKKGIDGALEKRNGDDSRRGRSRWLYHWFPDRREPDRSRSCRS